MNRTFPVKSTFKIAPFIFNCRREGINLVEGEEDLSFDGNVKLSDYSLTVWLNTDSPETMEQVALITRRCDA